MQFRKKLTSFQKFCCAKASPIAIRMCTMHAQCVCTFFSFSLSYGKHVSEMGLYGSSSSLHFSKKPFPLFPPPPHVTNFYFQRALAVCISRDIPALRLDAIHTTTAVTSEQQQQQSEWQRNQSKVLTAPKHETLCLSRVSFDSLLLLLSPSFFAAPAKAIRMAILSGFLSQCSNFH